MMRVVRTEIIFRCVRYCENKPIGAPQQEPRRGFFCGSLIQSGGPAANKTSFLRWGESP
jgi:hypothetical protein